MTGNPESSKAERSSLGSNAGRALRSVRRKLSTPEGRWDTRLLWDALMVQMAFLNLVLILFDFSYLALRPFYLSHLPVVTRWYDPVKGIEPQPLTTRYLEVVDALEADPEPGERALLLEELSRLGDAAADHRPFERVGQQREIRLFDARLRAFLERRDGIDEAGLSSADALDRLWRIDDPGELETTLAFFDAELRPLLAVNYYRAFDVDGEYVDHGWLVDLPFLILFTLEFYGRWFVAWRRRRYAEWWVFPLLHWYDFLGIVPLPQFRFFRLFRIVSLYVRLKRSDRSTIGEDFVSRSLAQLAQLVSQEVTDRVTVRILAASQQALAGGIQARITRAVLEPKREEMRRELARAVERAVQDPTIRANARRIFDLSLDHATANAESLRYVPLPRTVMEPVVRAVGGAIFEAVTRSLDATLSSDEGREALETLLGEAVDGALEEFTAGTAERLLRQSLFETLEEVKSAVSVRDWAETDEREPAGQRR